MSVLRLGAVSLAAVAVAAAVIGGDDGLRQQTTLAVRTAHRLMGERVEGHMPATWRRGLAARLVAAGVDPGAGLALAIGLQCTSAVVAVVCLVGVTAVGGGGVWTGVGLVVALLVVAAPELTLRRRIERRRSSMARDLPRLLDLLVISVEAGLGLDQALTRVVRAVPGALADEFARLLTEVGAGVPRTEALRSLAARCPVPELRSFTLAMVQAETYGVSVGPLLRAQASEIRTRHRQAAQMLAQKAPVKLLIPMVLCIFPALLVVVAGPALLSVRSLIAR